MPDLDDASIQEFLDLVFDFVCQRPLSDLVDADRVLAALDEVLSPTRVADVQARLLAPARARLIERASKSALKVSAWLPPEVATTLAEMLGEPAPLPRKLVDELVASERVRDEVRAMLNDLLTSFVSKMAAAGQGTGGGLLGGALGFGARAMSAAGKGLLGGLGEEFQRQLQGRVREFVDASVSALQARIADKLKSEQTARDLGKGRRKAFLTLLERTEREAAAAARKLPYERIDPLVPKVIAHNLARAEVREAIRDELRAALEELSRESIGETLSRAGLLTAAREALHHHGRPLARAFVRTPGFEAWWARAR